MASFFSIIPPPIGTEGVNVPLIPDIEEILKFSEGDIGIADTIKKNFLYKTMSAGKFSSLEAIETFTQRGGLSTEKEIESYDKGNGRFRIPIDDIQLGGDDLMGIKALEKVVLKCIFETQKPYMEFIPTAVKVLAELEQIAAKVLTLVNPPVRKPKFNKRSLTYKLNESKKELNQMLNFSKEKSNPLGNLTTEDKIKGFDLLSDLQQPNRKEDQAFSDLENINEFDWEIISTEYSTGDFIVGVDYQTIYRNIIDPRVILDDSEDPDSQIIDDEKPPVIVFGYYDNSGNDATPPTQWLDREYSPRSVGPSTTKWFGRWEQLPDNDPARYRRFLRDFINDRLLKKTGSSDPDLQNEAYDFIEPKIDPDSFVEDANENSFLNRLPKLGDDGLNLGIDSIVDVNRITNGRRRMFMPRKIRYNGKDIIIDPEADYELQVIKLIPTKEIYYRGEVDIYNQNLKKTTPIAGNYMGVNVRDALTREEYDVIGYDVTKPVQAEPRRVQRAFKYKFDAENTTNEDLFDNKVTYVIEGILRDNPKKVAENGGNDVGVDDGNDNNSPTVNPNLKWYLKPSFYTAVKDFIDILITIFIDIVPEITSIVKLFKSPHEFIFDIIFEKIEDGFEAFSSEIMEKFSSLKDFDDKFERADFIRNDPQLKKFVSVDEDLNYRFLLDGFSGMELLGFNFGINIMNFIPKMVLNKSNNFSLNQIKEAINGNTLPTQPNNAVTGETNGNSPGSTPTGTSNPVNASVRKLQNDGTYTWETVSVEYSTGEFVEGIDYKYIYVTEDVERLLSKGDELFEAAIRSESGLDEAVEALTNYNMAQEKDPNNQIIKDKIDELKSKFKFSINMILQFLMNFVSMPIKIVIQMLEEWTDFFKEMATIVKIPDKLTEFLSFDWVTKYMKPTGILELIGLRFNPELIFQWLGQIQSGAVDPNFEFDLNEVVSAPFLFQLPKVNAEQLDILKTKPLQMMTSIFKFIEMLIEGILCFIFNTLNLDTIIECPKFEISKFAAADLPLEDLQAVLNGDSSPLNPSGGSVGSSNADGSTYNSVPYKFVYDVKLQDGTIIKDLNYAELQQFMKDNQEFNYEVM